VAAVLAALVCAPTAGARPLVTAVHEVKASSMGDVAFARMRTAGAGVVRIYADWRSIAPTTEPASWNPTNPADPNYKWSGLDTQVRTAAAHGLRPLLGVRLAPNWAEDLALTGRGGTRAPDAVKFGLFARAITERYDGDFDPGSGVLPEVRLWEVWNEPNLAHYLTPQYAPSGRIISADIYRALVNAFSVQAHLVDPGNLVGGPALAPFGRDTGSTSSGPLAFTRTLVEAPVLLDAFSNHPYTQGGPSHSAYHPDDVSLGDLPQLVAYVRQQQRAGKIVTQGGRPIAFWSTEFSWDTNLPDPLGVPTGLHARWTAEALYRHWAAGYSLVTWWMVRDRGFTETYEQGGLWYCGAPSSADDGNPCAPPLSADQPKLALRAFRFPFVALQRRVGVYVWGRTPTSTGGSVLIQRKLNGGWRRLAVLRAGADGVFAKRFRIAKRGSLRARYAGETSLAFTVRRPRDVEVRYIFGCGGTIPCS
jgi:hypothetical protein